MKILTGRLKDTAIPFRPQPGLRPTPDRVRKAVMDSLAHGWEGARALDLFSGTGALGLEALSAGAAEAVFVESDRRRADAIARLARDLGLGDVCRVLAEDVFTAIGRLRALGERFDRVLADPPYEQGYSVRLLEDLEDGALLRPGAWLMVEAYKKEKLPERAGRLERRRTAFYGDTGVHYYVLV